jgi:hypothetical protein
LEKLVEGLPGIVPRADGSVDAIMALHCCPLNATFVHQKLDQLKTRLLLRRSQRRRIIACRVTVFDRDRTQVEVLILADIRGPEGVVRVVCTAVPTGSVCFWDQLPNRSVLPDDVVNRFSCCQEGIDHRLWGCIVGCLVNDNRCMAILVAKPKTFCGGATSRS